MDLNELQNEVDRDLKIDDTELDLESIRTPQLHNKYLKYYTKFSLQYKKAKDDYSALYKFKWEYYTGKSDPEVYQAKPFDPVFHLNQQAEKIEKTTDQLWNITTSTGNIIKAKCIVRNV